VLPPGTYFATVRAPGYQDADEQIEMRAGETRTWTPRLVPVAAPEPRTPAATPDRTADQEAVGTEIRAFVSALNRQDRNRVVPLLPPDVRDVWRSLLGSRAVSDFAASLQSLGDARFDGDAATVDLVINVSFRSDNQAQKSTLRYTGSLERGPSSWRLVALRQTGG